MSRALRMEWTKLRTDPGIRWSARGFDRRHPGRQRVRGPAPRRPCTARRGRAPWTPPESASPVSTSDKTARGRSGCSGDRSPSTSQRSSVIPSRPARAAAACSRPRPALPPRSARSPRRGRPGRHAGHGPHSPCPTTASPPPTGTRCGCRWPRSQSAEAYLGSVLYLGLVAVLSFGVAVMVRHTGAAISGDVGLLYVTPIAALFVTDPLWQGRNSRSATPP